MQRLEFYSTENLVKILTRSARLLQVPADELGIYEIAKRARGTPRIANRLLRRVRDFAQVEAQGTINQDIAKQALQMLEVDSEGFDMMDRKLLMAIMERFAGGPVGLESMAASIGEEKHTIEDVIEPFLIQQGFLMRTPRGRVVTEKTYQHFGLEQVSS